MSAFPQYAKSVDPLVIAAIERNREGFQAFRRQAFAFADAQGVPDGAYFGSSFGGSHRIAAIGGEEKPTTGQWKAGYRRGWLPFKSNPISQELAAVKFDEEKVSGLPQLLESASQDGSRRVASPLAFVLDGVAFSGTSFLPVDLGGETIKPGEGGWVEIKASEFHAALESYNDKIKEHAA